LFIEANMDIYHFVVLSKFTRKKRKTEQNEERIRFSKFSLHLIEFQKKG